ncbi:MAG: HD-GYP domain-containing protein [Chloroflexi bacterium]|nr:MAG: HD-GYP domain-containing protein [Chloroflexota bacterium]
MTPRQRSELYRVGVGLAALATFAATAPRLRGERPDWWLVAALAVAGILALEFPLHVNISEKVSVATAVFFAAVLLLPVWQAAALVGLLQSIDICVAAFRKVRATRERPPLRAVASSIVFNGGQAYLSTLAAASLLSTAGVSARAGLTGPGDAVVLVGSAGTMYLANLLFVAVAIAIGTSRSPLPLFFNTQKLVYVQFAALYLVGTAAAFAAVRYTWLPLLAIVPAVLVYHSLRQRVEMGRDAMRAMERMAEEVDRRDPYTYNHSQRVAIYTHAIARKLGFGSVDVELLELAAKVHDIGKIRVPDSVLLKPAKLTPEERRIMETHPRLGFDILRPFSEYAKVLDLVLSHHERYDGKGYPNGTVGRRLLLIAQVIPVADSLDAMTSARAYRGARTWESALEELRRGAGTQWNPQVVEAALAALGQTEREPVRQASAIPVLA